VYRFVGAEKATFGVKAICDVFNVSPSAYYAWERNRQSEHARKDAELLGEIRQIFGESRGRYGAPRVHAELAGKGIRVSRKRVARLMREAELRAKGRRKYKATTDSKHSLPCAPNLLARQFSVGRPDAAWVSDITYVWTNEGWLYLATVIDLYSRKVVGWSLCERMTSKLICDALDAAVRQRRPPPGLLFHSDRGSQYASTAFRRRLWRYRMCQSMSRKGNCWDNAVAESFFATLKKELIRDQAYTTRAAARAEIFEYIEVFYNRRRTHSLLGYTTPAAFDSCTGAAATA